MAIADSPGPPATSIEGWLQQQGIAEAGGSDTAGNEIEDTSSEVGLISMLYYACADRMSQLVRNIDKNLQVRRRVRKEAKEVEAKFRLFGRSFDQGKLESCLDDDEIFETVLRLLLAIANILNSGHVIALVDQRTPSDVLSDDEPVQSLDQLIERAHCILDITESDKDTTDSDNEEDATTSEPVPKFQQRWLQPLFHNTDMLMELVPTLEASLQLKHRTQLKHFLRQPLILTSAAGPYVNNVRDKFPKARSDLVDRLGEANWQRHERLRNICSEETPAVDDMRAPVAPLQGAKSLFQPVSVFKDSALGSSLRTISERAASVASHSSFLSSANGDAKRKLRVPKLPRGSEWGQPFVCPFCQKLVDSNTRIAWKMHVYSDLQAYVCTWSNCPQMLTTYLVRNAWAQHEIDHHLSYIKYQCPTCLELNDTEEGFLQHLHHIHNITTTVSLQPAILAKSRRLVQHKLAEIKCNLCLNHGFLNDRDYATHVGRHLEEIALIALPPTGNDGDDDENSSDDGNSCEDDTDTSLEKKNRPPSPAVSLRPIPKASTHPATMSSYTTIQLCPEGDEYVPRDFDNAGEKKVDALGYLQGGRSYSVRTFTLPGRGQKLFMLATECARVLGYRDPYLLCNKNEVLFKIITSQAEKDHLIAHGILPYSYRARQIAIIAARSIFRQFGSKIIEGGRRVLDDYWESKLIKQGLTEANLPVDKRPGTVTTKQAVQSADRPDDTLGILPNGQTISHAHWKVLQARDITPPAMLDTQMKQQLQGHPVHPNRMYSHYPDPMFNNPNLNPKPPNIESTRNNSIYNTAVTIKPQAVEIGSWLRQEDAHEATSGRFEPSPSLPRDSVHGQSARRNTEIAGGASSYTYGPENPFSSIGNSTPQDHSHIDSHAEVSATHTPDSSEDEPLTWRCPYENCEWTGKCESEFKKHTRQHIRSFKCDILGCDNTRDFSNHNDLERHRSSEHRTYIEGKLLNLKRYRCLVPGCPKTEHVFKRSGNFKAHIKRMHPYENIDEIVKRSEDYYSTCHLRKPTD